MRTALVPAAAALALPLAANAQISPFLPISGTQTSRGEAYATTATPDSYSIAAPDPLASWSPPHQSVAATGGGQSATLDTDFSSTIESQTVAFSTRVVAFNSGHTLHFEAGWSYNQQFELSFTVPTAGTYLLSGELWRQISTGWDFTDESDLTFGRSGDPLIMNLSNLGRNSNLPTVVSFSPTYVQLVPGTYTVSGLDQSMWGEEYSAVESRMSFSLQACYANCDNSSASPVLNVADFTCFLQKYAAGDAYANCDGSTSPLVLNVADFTCFMQKFAAGCP